MFVLRFTPACAGTCFEARRWPLRPPVHPRVRGDMQRQLVDALGDLGSPPRARGHGTVKRRRRVSRRFTPACAGTCDALAAVGVVQSVHPRVRGDMHGYIRRWRADCGSPPRARGHAHADRRLDRRTRFTPACAGT